MKLENQVCSLELARKLKKLGVKQDSLWYWVGSQVLSKDNRLRLANAVDMPLQEYSAYTVAELGELLPRDIKIECGICTVKEWRIILFEKNLDVNSKEFMIEKTIKIISGLTEANARAKMLIYLIENKLIKANT